jgi:hypothetical protein
MTSHPRPGDLDRRAFLKGSCAAALGLSGGRLERAIAPARSPRLDDAPNTHNMLVVGQRTVFLSHLPMFEGVTADGAAFTSPHRFQVILEATFTRGGRDVTALYMEDRRAHPRTRLYTLNPARFVLPHLLASGPQPAPLRSFPGTVFRGHLERGGVPIPGLEGVTVVVTRVVYAQQLVPRTPPPPQLEYLLFGRGPERFLAHHITAPPDFDQVLAVRVDGGPLTDEALGRGVRVGVPGRASRPARRLKEGERAAAVLLGPGATSAGRTAMQLRAGTELYFEEGELRVPATFAPTADERKAGF